MARPKKSRCNLVPQASSPFRLSPILSVFQRSTTVISKSSNRYLLPAPIHGSWEADPPSLKQTVSGRGRAFQEENKQSLWQLLPIPSFTRFTTHSTGNRWDFAVILASLSQIPERHVDCSLEHVFSHIHFPVTWFPHPQKSHFINSISVSPICS